MRKLTAQAAAILIAVAAMNTAANPPQLEQADDVQIVEERDMSSREADPAESLADNSIELGGGRAGPLIRE